MARVTVEDCVQIVPNRFELVMVAAQRARDIHAGQEIKVDRDNDKNPVVALREIAEHQVAVSDLKESLIQGHQRPPEVDEPEDEIVELMAGETGYQGPASPEGADLADGMSIEGGDDDEDEGDELSVADDEDSDAED